MIFYKITSLTLTVFYSNVRLCVGFWTEHRPSVDNPAPISSLAPQLAEAIDQAAAFKKSKFQMVDLEGVLMTIFVPHDRNKIH